MKARQLANKGIARTSKLRDALGDLRILLRNPDHIGELPVEVRREFFAIASKLEDAEQLIVGAAKMLYDIRERGEGKGVSDG